MTEFELLVNGRNPVEGDSIITIAVNDMEKGERMTADVIAYSLYDVDRKLNALQGHYEVDRLDTLCNYFSPRLIDKWGTELINSQAVYFAPFGQVVEYLLPQYVKYLAAGSERALQMIDRMDARWRECRPPEKCWGIYRDGKLLFTSPDEAECFGKLHRIQSSSVHHATTHEGYSIEEIK